VGVANFFCQSICIDETITFQLKFFSSMRFLRVRVGVVYSRNELALRLRLRNLNQKSQFSIFDIFWDIRVHIYDFLKFVGGLRAFKWAWQSFFESSIGIDETNTIQQKNCGRHRFGRLVGVGVGVAYSHFRVTNLRSVQDYGI